MKNYIYILIALSFASLLSSCETEVNLDLNSIEPRLVIDAEMKEGEPCVVKLKMTQDVEANPPAPVVSGATIKISDGTNSETLYESKDGIYSSSILGTPNKTYTLDVTVDTKTYTAKATLPEATVIDSLYLFSIDAGNEMVYLPTIIFKNTPNIENHFMIRITVNGKKMRLVDLENDKNRGPIMNHHIYVDDEYNDFDGIEVGDTIAVELQSVNKAAHDYFFFLTSSSNPYSNFSGGVLGLFKTYSSNTMERVLTEEYVHGR